jgi:hypothetical protein
MNERIENKHVEDETYSNYILYIVLLSPMSHIVYGNRS